jgi:protein-disulfide isomerase
MEEQKENLTPIPMNPMGFDKTKLILPGAILIAAIMISATLFYVKIAGVSTGSADEGPVKVEASVDDDPVLGDPKAKVTIIEFSDFQCPYCRSFWSDTLPQIKKDYIDTGKVKLVYRDFPLSFHAAAEPAAQASECADDQGKYWEYHDKLFSEQSKGGIGTITFGATELKLWAQQIGLDGAMFNQCLDSGKHKDEVAKDLADGNGAQVSGTPAFIINGKLLVGAQPYSVFKKMIDEEL